MDKETLKKLWKNKRTHSLMVLLLWVISLGLLMGVVAVMNEFNPQTKQEKTKIEEKQNKKNVEEKLQDLRSDEFLMTFRVTKKDGTLKYEGTEQNGVVNGYKEDKNGIKKYRIEQDKIYEIVLEQATEIDNIYEEIIPEFLDRQTLISLLLETVEENIINSKERSTYEYNLFYKEENVKVNIVDSKDSIETITIESETTEYQLTFNRNKN